MKIDKYYPICDTDVWIKNAKHKEYYKCDLIYKKYDKVYMSDAVRQELGRERRDDKEKDFILGLNTFNEFYKGELVTLLRLNDNNLFNDEMFSAIERELLKYKIYYDRKTGKYISTVSDTGETVTVIIASMLNIPIVLCDEEKKGCIIKRYKQLDIRNFKDLLKIVHGEDEEYLEGIRRKLSAPISRCEESLKRTQRDAIGASKLLKFKNKYVM